MSTSTSIWKLEDENSFPVNCFPARGVGRKLNEGAGSWIVAYAEEQQTKFHASFKPARHIQIQLPGEETELQSQLPKHKPKDANVLNASFLLQRHHVNSVLDLCSVNISDCNLDAVSEEDFVKFINVAYINAAENLLPFHPFNSFLNLRELELPVNGLRNLNVEYGDFPSLQVLDLSYNNLSAEDVLSLGVLEKLKVLTLTGNGMHAIHTDMARPVVIPLSNNQEEIVPRFNNLEVLLLDDNHLTDLSTFASLAALPQLRELNLDKNGLEIIPHLKVVGDKVVSETHSAAGYHVSGTPSSRKSRKSRKTASAKSKNSPKPEEVQPDDSKRNMATSTTSLNRKSGQQVEQQQAQQPQAEQQETEDKPTLLPTTPELLGNLSTPAPSPPFQQLRLLSVANNLIREEECVLAVAAWPRLKHVVLHGNPIIKKNSGEPPLLSHYLRERLGINIHRFQQRTGLTKPHLMMPAEKDRQVTAVVPKIPKQPVDSLIKSLMAPQPMEPHPPTTPHPSRTSIIPKLVTSSADEEDNGDKEENQEENVFLTQVDEVSDLSHSHKYEKKSHAKAKREIKQPKTQDDTQDPRYKGFEVLLDAKEDPNLHQPVGIQANVRSLHHMLAHPAIYRSSDVTLDRVLPTYQAKVSKHDSALAVARDRRKVKAPTKSEKLKTQLERIRTRNVIEVEVPLPAALYYQTDKVTVDEAEVLLEEVEDKYRVVREASLKKSAMTKDLLDEIKKLGI